MIGTALLTPCVRNVWTIASYEHENWNDRQIRYGESICIQICKSDPPLYVEAPIETPLVPRGECGHPIPRLVPWKGPYTR